MKRVEFSGKKNAQGLSEFQEYGMLQLQDNKGKNLYPPGEDAHGNKNVWLPTRRGWTMGNTLPPDSVSEAKRKVAQKMKKIQ